MDLFPAFLVDFLAAGFLATFLVVFLAAGFLATFLMVFLALVALDALAAGLLEAVARAKLKKD